MQDLADQIQQLAGQGDTLGHAFLSLPLAAALGALLAFRPRRRGTPPRTAPVVQTQILLAIVGATVMLVVGASLARAFGIVGAANLIRYRAKIDDPKDAVVMLSTLSIGLAAGVGLYVLAVFSTLFILIVLWLVESFEPETRKLFALTVRTPDAAAHRAAVEGVLRRYRLTFELRGATQDQLTYETHMPFDLRTDRVANAILRTSEGVAVEWEEKKARK